MVSFGCDFSICGPLGILVILILYSPVEHGYSIFVRNLPSYASIALVEVEFGKFGAVKPDGVQVVHHQVSVFWLGWGLIYDVYVNHS